MPIYAYRCSQCGHALDALQKLAEARLTDCPACGAATLVKQLSAAGFQLKGSGWYATDFKGGKSKQPTEGEGEKPSAKTDDKSDGTSDAKGDAKGDSKSDDKSAAKPDAKPASGTPSESKGETKAASTPSSSGSTSNVGK